MLAVICLCCLTGCGLQPESEPRSVSPPRGPFAPITPSAATAPAPGGPFRERLFFVHEGRLVVVIRQVRQSPTVSQLVADLAIGPSPQESDDGVTSALSGTSLVAGVEVIAGLAVVELVSGPTEGAGRTDEVLAFAQVVCTLSEHADVTGVVFTHAQHPVGVPRADGQLSQAPLTQNDYGDLLPTQPMPAFGQN